MYHLKLFLKLIRYGIPSLPFIERQGRGIVWGDDGGETSCLPSNNCHCPNPHTFSTSCNSFPPLIYPFQPSTTPLYQPITRSLLIYNSIGSTMHQATHLYIAECFFVLNTISFHIFWNNLLWSSNMAKSQNL